MREVLFRGKRVDNGEWIEGFYIFDNADNQPRIAIERIYSTGTFLDVNAPRVNSETVGQYTGLTDKNGKKIFEGDIVKSREYISDIKGNIANCSCCHSVYGFSTNDDNLSIFYCEVIGNIHDNPELLEGKE